MGRTNSNQILQVLKDSMKISTFIQATCDT